MKKSFALILGLIIWSFLSSFSGETELKIPDKRIRKAIQKLWKTEDYRLVLKESTSCNSNGGWYKIESGTKIIGIVYVGRVNSCRSGGCSVESKDLLTFEYFDYLLFTDILGEVLWVKVFNYQATQGHEVMSRGWLNQFKGLVPFKQLDFGRDIETISGATVSASAITDDIQKILKCAF